MITTQSHTKTLCVVENAIIFTLQYFAIWHYPLNTTEIFLNCNTRCTLQEIEAAILRLAEGQIIVSYKGYYSLGKDIENQVSHRIKSNLLAEKKLIQAKLAGKLIYAFPFVKFVGISGSLSKGCAVRNSDFDFFIVTTKNRLWICRTLLHAFKKLTFVFGQQHKFCMNYFVDETALTIEEKNNYTAIELASLIPVKGFETYKQLLNKNTWLKHFLPNTYMKSNDQSRQENPKPIKSLLENIINIINANKLNIAFMQVTDKKWRKKWMSKNYPVQDYDQAFKTRINISKNHPANYQKRVLEQLRKIELTANEILAQ